MRKENMLSRIRSTNVVLRQNTNFKILNTTFNVFIVMSEANIFLLFAGRIKTFLNTDGDTCEAN